jgi:hypothetical protein
MDEGFNTFINSLSSVDFNNGEYKQKPSDLHQESEEYTNPKLEAIMSSPDNMKEANIGTLCYSKPSSGLVILREQVLGPERFDLAFRTYTERWAFKHPTPDDFFRTIENVAGEDLSWFWRGWFQYNWRFDQGVHSIKYVKNDPKQGVIINIENFEKMPMPVVADVKTKSGKITRVKLPVEIWQKNTSWSFKHNSNEEIESVTLDPDHSFPDSNESNNVWTADKGIVEKAVVLDGYVGTYSNPKAPIKIVFTEKYDALSVEITGYPKFGVQPIGNNTFESKRAGLQFSFNAAQDGFEMIMGDGKRIPFTKEK